MRQFYVDHDGDGFGDADAIVEDCKQSEGLVLVVGDCNDRDESVHPDAGELCDAANVDEDCDGLFGADDPDVQDARVFYADSDGDAYGLAGSTPTIACDQPAGTVTNAYDCDDDNALVNPSQLEVCDGASLDDDCDGMVDDADPESLKTDYWPDVDEDTFGDERIAATHTCFDLTSSGYVLNGEDCDDQVTAVNPDAVELCGPDHVDDDCDGRIDEADSDTDTHNWYVDGDADGYGEDGSTPVVTCQIIPGSATRAGDCDDADPTLNPGVDDPALMALLGQMSTNLERVSKDSPVYRRTDKVKLHFAEEHHGNNVGRRHAGRRVARSCFCCCSDGMNAEASADLL